MNYNFWLVTHSDISQDLIEDTKAAIDSFGLKLQGVVDSQEKDLPSKEAFFLLLLSDSQIQHFLTATIGLKSRIAILPTPSCPKAMSSYAISNQMDAALEDALNEEQSLLVDTLTCNERVVLEQVSIGDMHDLFTVSHFAPIGRLKLFFKNISHISYEAMEFTTSKNNKTNTAASGVMVVGHTLKSNTLSLKETLSFQDGTLTAIIFAPSSLLAYWFYLIYILFITRFSIQSLPKSIGLIRTSKLHISSNKGLHFSVDGVGLSAKTVTLEVHPGTHYLQLGRSLFEVKQSYKPSASVERIRVDSIPKKEMGSLLASGYVPLFKKAEEKNFKELFTALRANGKISSSYLVLMALSTLLATTGLFQDSTPVIIGAMILAPMMGPIMTLSMGIVRLDKDLLLYPIKTLFTGIAIALFFSCIYTLIVPLETITPQMSARLNPNLLDLMVAIFSGIAGAYAQSKSEVAKSLAGVAIAVALIPPLGVTGIGLGWLDWSTIYGSFLLFCINLIGMTMAAAATFTILGFAPIKRAKHGLTYLAIIIGIIIVPLGLSFQTLIKENHYQKKLSSIPALSLKNQPTVELKMRDIKIAHPTLVNLEVTSSKPLTAAHRDAIKNHIQTILNESSLRIFLIEKIEI